VCCALAGCQQKMASQPSFRPDEPSPLFADGRANRPLVPGTVARGHLRIDSHLFTGKRTLAINAAASRAAAVATAEASPLSAAAAASSDMNDYVDTFPFPVTRDVLRHGQNRYMIYCVVCHDPLGTGHGKIVERGYTRPPSYHIDRLRTAPVGYLFDVITNGYGSMPQYRQQVPPRDRWAIVAYIRALQTSQHYLEKDLPEELRKEWDSNAKQGGRGP
jgi:mono/diheme cytochrome c family protein